MKVTLNLSTIILVLTLVLAVGFALNHLSGRKHQLDIDMLNTTIYEQGVETETYKVQVNGLEETVFEAQALIITKDSEILNLEGNNARLKELNIKNVDVIGTLRARIAVLIDSIPPAETITIIEQPDGNYAKLPLDYTYTDYWADMHTTVNENGLADMVFVIRELQMNIVIGTKGQGFLKKNKPVSSITTDCPYIQIDESTIAVVQNNVSPYTYLGIGAGVTAGFVILLNLLTN